jgi:phosphoenolpyruvate carboxykinase (GTP)
MRVLKWMIDRLEGNAEGREHAFGISPSYGEIEWSGLNFSASQFDAITHMDSADWAKELELHAELFKMLEHRLPQALVQTKAQLEERLAA